MVILLSQGMSPCTMSRFEGFSFNRIGEKCSNATDLQPVVAMANHQATTERNIWVDIFLTSSLEFMLSEHAICCSMCPPLEVKESPKERRWCHTLKKKKEKKNAPECELYQGRTKKKKHLLILHLTPGRLAYTVWEKYVNSAITSSIFTKKKDVYMFFYLFFFYYYFVYPGKFLLVRIFVLLEE